MALGESIKKYSNLIRPSLFLKVLVVLPAAAPQDRAQVEVAEAPQLQRGHSVLGELLVRAAALERLPVVVDGVRASVCDGE